MKILKLLLGAKKQWDEFAPEERAEIDRRVADMQVRIAVQKRNNH